MSLLTFEQISKWVPKPNARAESIHQMRARKQMHHLLLSEIMDARVEAAMDRAVVEFDREMREAGY